MQGPLGYTSFGGIIFWAPLMMFVFLFGISMDYHVFILSRVRELWARGGLVAKTGERRRHRDERGGNDQRRADNSGVVLAVLNAVADRPQDPRVGTAAAVIIDATVVRGVLVRAALALPGDHAWSSRNGGVPPAPGR